MLVSTKEMLEGARAGGYAIPSPNFVDSNSARAFVSVAEELRAPIILGYSQANAAQLSLEEAAAIGRFYAERASVPVALHLDHATSFPIIRKAIDLGFTSVMIDGSTHDVVTNVCVAQDVVAYAHARGVAVESAMGHVGCISEDGLFEPSFGIETDVESALLMVGKAHVDSLAVSIGTSMGGHRYLPRINFELLAQLRQAIDVPLVLHGGSGAGDENLLRCAREGICKVNLYTDLVGSAYECVYERKPTNWLGVLKAGERAMMDVLRRYYCLLGCGNPQKHRIP